MGYTIASTKWPSISLPEGMKELLEGLFLSLDDSSESGGNRLADDIFIPDGEMVSNHSARGSTAIRQARKNAWNVITQRRHEILKVYAADSEGTDLMLFGKITAGLRNGEYLTSDFAARVIVQWSEGSNPKVQLYQPIVDTAPVLEALKKE